MCSIRIFIRIFFLLSYQVVYWLPYQLWISCLLKIKHPSDPSVLIIIDLYYNEHSLWIRSIYQCSYRILTVQCACKRSSNSKIEIWWNIISGSKKNKFTRYWSYSRTYHGTHLMYRSIHEEFGTYSLVAVEDYEDRDKESPN